MSISAVLLAGGESHRMGRDKATLDWRGRPLWEWQIEKLRALCPQKILLSARLDPPWRPADVELILDTSPSRGPLSGLAAALASIETDHLLALAIDMPLMTTEHLRLLCGLATNGTGVIPVIDVRKVDPQAKLSRHAIIERFELLRTVVPTRLKPLNASERSPFADPRHLRGERCRAGVTDGDLGQEDR